MTNEIAGSPPEIIERSPIFPSEFIELIKENIERNSLLMPDFLDHGVIPDPNLYSIYKESYFCILCGFYNSGILLLGQLMEITLKEIILIKTGELKKGTFGKALEYADKKKIIFEEDYRFLLRFKTEIRDPYTHRDFKKILGFYPMPIWQIPIEGDPLEWIKRLGYVCEGIKSGKYPPQFIDAASSTMTASIAKDQVDEKRAIFWAWKIYSELEQLLTIYLNQESYNEFQQKYGSPFESVVRLQIEDDEVE